MTDARSFGIVILLLVLSTTWMVAPVMMFRSSTRWPAWAWWAYYVGPPFVLGGALVILGGR